MRFVIRKISKEEMIKNTNNLLKDKGYDYKFIEEGDNLLIKVNGEKESNEVVNILCKYEFEHKVSTPIVV